MGEQLGLTKRSEKRVTMYAVLFRFLIFLGANPWLVGVITLFATGVAAGQALLFRGTKPREASFLMGSVLCPLMLLDAFAGDALFGWPLYDPAGSGIRTVAQFVSAMAYLSIVGVASGYFAGCTAAGVFFVMDRIKRQGGADDPASTNQTAIGAEEHSGASLCDRLWQRLQIAIRRLSARQAGRPWREAANMFILVAILLGLAVPYVTSGKRVPAVMVTVAIALVIGFWWGGTRVAGWKALMVFVLLGAMGSLGPAAMLRQLYL